MKTQLKTMLFLLGVLLSINSCKKSKAIKSANVNMAFKIMSGSTPVQLNTPIQYALNATTSYNATAIKFYINNVRMVTTAGTMVEAKNYTLLDFDDGKNSYTFKDVPAGDYKSIMFNVGVDYERNHSGAQDGDLDPVTGMIWSWSTGYIFYKHEGQFTSKVNQNKSLIFHLGTDKAYIPDVTLPIENVLKVNGENKTANITLDLNKLYTGIDFDIDNNRQSGAIEDGPWITTLRNNFPTAFTLQNIQ